MSDFNMDSLDFEERNLSAESVTDSPARAGSSRSRRSSASFSDSRSKENDFSSSEELSKENSDDESSEEEEQGRLSNSKIRSLVKVDIRLQMEDVVSRIDQEVLKANVKKAYKNVRGLTDAYVPNSRTSSASGLHVAGCPCSFCEELGKDLSEEDRLLITRIRALRNWVPKGQARPECLHIPVALLVTGPHPPPYIF